ncbi:MAG: BamA/TamA family outer membrane protein [Acidobacteriota bacterium]
MQTFTRKRQVFLELASLLVLLSLTSLTALAQGQEPSPDDSPSSRVQTFRPRSFLLTPPSFIPPNPDTEATLEADSASAAPAQGIPKNLPFKVTSEGRKAPRRQELTVISFGTKYVNALFGGFEQGSGFGFGVQFTTADKIPGVKFRARALVSTRFYRKFELSAYLPKVGSDKNHGEVWFTYLRRTRDTFFGLGPRSNEADRTNFDLETRDIEGMFVRDFTPKLSAGLYLGRINISSYRGQFEDEPPIDILFSGNPNVQPITRWVPGLREHLEFFAYGGFFEADGRNDDHGLTRGGFLYARAASADGINNNLPTTYGWTEGQIDGRVYVPLFSDKTSFAFRAMADLRSPKGGSQIPFYMNSFLGGRSFVRGFTNYRFRSHNLLLFSGELRQTVYAMKEDRGVDIAFFGDLGRSWGDTRSKTNAAIIRNDKFGEAPWRASFGPAVQFRYNKDLAVRIDWGHSTERNILYFSISRGF